MDRFLLTSKGINRLYSLQNQGLEDLGGEPLYDYVVLTRVDRGGLEQMYQGKVFQDTVRRLYESGYIDRAG